MKFAHFIPGKFTYTASKWAWLYLTEIVRLHGVPVSIVSDRDACLTFKFWKRLQVAMDTRLDFGTTFHPQTDGQTEHLNQVLEDMLRACALELLDKGFLKVAPMKGVLRFEKKEKLSPLFVESFEILERISLKYMTDLSHVIDYKPLKIDENLSYTEQPVEILARELPDSPPSSSSFGCLVVHSPPLSFFARHRHVTVRRGFLQSSPGKAHRSIRSTSTSVVLKSQSRPTSHRIAACSSLCSNSLRPYQVQLELNFNYLGKLWMSLQSALEEGIACESN
ncbi:pol protein [Cucumis melo var. makuwa]|uniref:Pol protein n=1 Tax=Cucumis melo var. makuwa TaxID=1194695 RepID=A0A5D3D614_CUCMM|nr:pol protein [Cucumis melo var. makuwa]TYK18999.1 pol protein [Cucumis melo var. makuwa]